MNRSARRVLLRLVLLASPLLVLTFVAIPLLYSVDLVQSRNALSFATEVQTAPCGTQQLPSEIVTTPQPPHEDLQQQLQQLKRVISQLEDRLRLKDEILPAVAIDVRDNSVPCSSNYIQKQIEQSEIEKGKKWHNEYEVIPHALFTLSAFYSTEAGMGRRVVERPIGSRRQDLQEAVSSALYVLNHREPGASKHYVASDFVEGLYRIDPIEGTTYEMWFHGVADNNNSKEPDLVRVSLLKPHAPLAAVRLEQQSRTRPIVNIIVPLSGRLSAFESFLSRFHINVLSAEQSRIHLTVVFFGDQHWEEIQREMLAFERASGFSNFHLLNINTTFSRARGLQVGVEHWENSPVEDDVLVFLCDVDIAFDAAFIDRCRRNAHPKRQAYFPIVFSQYNPNVTRRFSHQRDDSSIPVLHKETGFWRDFGFGMVCTYRSDFMSLGGFHGGDESTGWGGEDLFLYRKYIRSTMRVIRAPDKNLFHLWHPKECPATLGPVQRRACLQSRGRNEASYDQLALLLFSNGESHHVSEPEI